MENVHNKIEVVSEKKPASLIIQILLVVNLLSPMYKGFFNFPYRDLLLVGLSITFVLFCVWHLRESFSWTDLIIGIMLVFGLFYYRFVTQRGHISLIYSIPFFVIGFSLAILFKYSIIPRRTFLVFMALALLPFLYASFFKTLQMQGESYFYDVNRNEIPMRLIIASSLQVMNETLQKRKYIIMFPSTLTLVCAYFSNSRAGILMAALLFGVVLITNVWNKRKTWIKENKGKAFIIISFFILIVLIGGYFAIKETRLVSRGLKDPARITLVVEFFKQLTFRKFLTGFYPTLPWGLKSHSSFQTMLTYYGIFAFVIYYFIVVALIHYWKHSFTLFGLLGMWCVYSLVESLGPIFIGDFLLIPLLMLAFYQKGKELMPNKGKPIQLVRNMFVKEKVES